MPTLSASQIAGYAKNSGVPPNQVATATAIALVESGGQTDVTNHNTDGSTDFGVWQINSVHKDLLNGKDWRDPAQNAAMMFAISKGGTNWTPWSVYKSGKYLTKMPQAQSATPDTSVGPAQNASITSDFSAIQKFAQLITDPHTWLRVGEIMAGSILLFMALKKSFNIPITPPMGKLVGKVIA